MNRICAEVQAQLPPYVSGSLSRLRRRLVAVHLRRCSACQGEFSRQRTVSRGLADLALSSPAGDPPPADLLAHLLDTAARPGTKARLASPARGAVSGARPALSVMFLVAGAAAGTGLGYASRAGWRGARAARHRRGSPR